MARRRQRLVPSLAGILLLALGASLLDYARTGSVQWPAELWQEALQQQATDGTSLYGQVLRIADGDTFTLQLADGSQERVRLYGVDTPERDQPHGRAATTALASLIEGRDLRVEVVERDTYDRAVGQVWIGDLDINLALVEGGHAWWYEYYARDRQDLEQAQAEARRARRGLWQLPNPVAPWDWRRGKR